MPGALVPALKAAYEVQDRSLVVATFRKRLLASIKSDHESGVLDGELDNINRNVRLWFASGDDALRDLSRMDDDNKSRIIAAAAADGVTLTGDFFQRPETFTPPRERRHY